MADPSHGPHCLVEGAKVVRVFGPRLLCLVESDMSQVFVPHPGAGRSEDMGLVGRWQGLWSHVHTAHKFTLCGSQEGRLPSCVARASCCG